MYTLITGASSGIGRELARLYANENRNLILVARSEEALNNLKKELSQENIEIVLKFFDLSKTENCFKLFDEIKNFDIELFINNAGYGNLGNFTETKLDLEINMLNLNILAPHILTKLYIQNYKKGLVVNVGSMAGFLPTPTLATYAATKAYVNSLSIAINYELIRQNIDIRVLTVAPGPVMTKFNERAKANMNRGMSAERCARIIKKGIEKKKSLIIPGFTMKLTYFLLKFVPSKLLLKASYSLQNKK